MYIDDEIKFNYNSRRFFTDNKEVYRRITTSEKIKKILEEKELDDSVDEENIIKQTIYENTNIIEMDYSLTEEEKEQKEFEEYEKKMLEEEEKDITRQKYDIIGDYMYLKYEDEIETYNYFEFFIEINLFIEKNKDFLIRNNLLKPGFLKTKLSKNLVLFLISELCKTPSPQQNFVNMKNFNPDELKRDSFHEYNFLDISYKL